MIIAETTLGPTSCPSDVITFPSGVVLLQSSNRQSSCQSVIVFWRFLCLLQRLWKVLNSTRFRIVSVVMKSFQVWMALYTKTQTFLLRMHEVHSQMEKSTKISTSIRMWFCFRSEMIPPWNDYFRLGINQMHIPFVDLSKPFSITSVLLCIQASRKLVVKYSCLALCCLCCVVAQWKALLFVLCYCTVKGITSDVFVKSWAKHVFKRTFRSTRSRAVA